ncbi:hypothetical protein Tco_0948140 [Tanacetum coccineum]
MEGFIKDDDDESRSKQMKQWNIYANYDDAYEINHEREELCKVQDEYDDLAITRKEACLAYQEIFQIMDEGWTVAGLRMDMSGLYLDIRERGLVWEWMPMRTGSWRQGRCHTSEHTICLDLCDGSTAGMSSLARQWHVRIVSWVHGNLAGDQVKMKTCQTGHSTSQRDPFHATTRRRPIFLSAMHVVGESLPVRTLADGDWSLSVLFGRKGYIAECG